MGSRINSLPQTTLSTEPSEIIVEKGEMVVTSRSILFANALNSLFTEHGTNNEYRLHTDRLLCIYDLFPAE